MHSLSSPRSELLRHTILLPGVDKVGQPGEVVRYGGRYVSKDVSDSKLKRLQGEEPSRQPAVVDFHAVDPCEGTGVGLQVKLPSKEVVSKTLQGQFDGESLLLNNRVLGFPWEQLPTQIHNGMFLTRISLDQHRTQTHCRAVHLDQEAFRKVWIL